VQHCVFCFPHGLLFPNDIISAFKTCHQKYGGNSCWQYKAAVFCTAAALSRLSSPAKFAALLASMSVSLHAALQPSCSVCLHQLQHQQPELAAHLAALILPTAPYLHADSITAWLCHQSINVCKIEPKSHDNRAMAEEQWLWCAGRTAASDARWSDLAVAAAAADKPSSGAANPTLTAQQAARRSAHKATSRMLDARSEAEKAAQLQFADAAQWEYEDEYDDSYDDLAPFGNDGIADAEGMLPFL